MKPLNSRHQCDFTIPNKMEVVSVYAEFTELYFNVTIYKSNEELTTILLIYNLYFFRDYVK